MPATKSGHYPKWIHSFSSYWAIDNHHERQKLLVEYFIATGSIVRPAPPTSPSAEEDIELTVAVMNTILADNVISKPFELGKMRHQKEKRFNILRQCVTAESFFVLYNIPKDAIHKFHVTHSKVPEKEEERCHYIHDILGIEKGHTTFASTPVSSKSLPMITTRREVGKNSTVLVSSCSSSRRSKVLDCVSKDVTEEETTAGAAPAPAAVTVTPTSRECKDAYRHSDSSGFSPFSNVVRYDLSAEINDVTVGDTSNKSSGHRHLPFLHQGRNDTILLLPQNAHTKEKLTWSQTETQKLAQDTITRKARKVLDLLHDLSKGNIVLANSIMLKVQKHCDQELRAGHHHSTGCSENILGGESKEKSGHLVVIENIQKMLHLPQFKSKGGGRQSQVQQTLYAIWTSMMGPSQGLGGEKTSISHRALTNILCVKPNHVFLKKCQSLRDELESGVENPFQNLISKSRRQKRWDNIDDEIAKSVWEFCHDTDVVRPDNYCKIKYSCLDENGLACKHHRHNWMVSGGLKVQLDLYHHSHHSKKLLHALKEKYPEKGLEEDFIKKKVHLRKFRKFVSNCVKEESRVSCIDPIEAKAYDLSRALQLFFRGHESSKKEIREIFLKEEEDIFNEFYQPSNSAGGSDGDVKQDAGAINDDNEEDDSEIYFSVGQNDKDGEEEDDEETQQQNMNHINYEKQKREQGSQQQFLVSDTSSSADDRSSSTTISTENGFLGHNHDCSMQSRSAKVSWKEQFQSCKCLACANGRGWMQIFRDIKGKAPHRELLNRCLCPKVAHMALTLDGEEAQPFIMHRWECGKQECKECGTENTMLLPWDCPVIQSSEKMKTWVWDKATGDNERTEKVERKISEVFNELKIALKDFSEHYIALLLFNRQRYLNLMQLDDKSAQICTDFASQLDLEPIRKVNCHTNKHASLAVFCVFFKDSIELDHGQTSISYTVCHEWFVFGGSDCKGKQNDWIFHNAALDHILIWYKENYPTKVVWDVWSDNCPSQYKCRQNLFQVSKKTHKHDHIEEFTHNFAKQYGFKSKSDTIGHWIKMKVLDLEKDYDMHAHNALLVYQLAQKYIRNNPTNYELLIRKGNSQEIKDALQHKSPYAATKRFVAYVEDEFSTYTDLCTNMNSVSTITKAGEVKVEHQIVFSDRLNMKRHEDLAPIKGTTEYYSYTHRKSDDICDVNDVPAIPCDASGNYYCRYCQKIYKSAKVTVEHELFCKDVITSGKGYKISFKYCKCYCRKCIAGERCPYEHITGNEKYKWLVSLDDEKEIMENIQKNIADEMINQELALSREAINMFLAKYSSNTTYPSMEETDCGLRRCHWHGMSKIMLGNDVVRVDGRSGHPRIIDYKHAFEIRGGWHFILRHFGTKDIS